MKNNILLLVLILPVLSFSDASALSRKEEAAFSEGKSLLEAGRYAQAWDKFHGLLKKEAEALRDSKAADGNEMAWAEQNRTKFSADRRDLYLHCARLMLAALQDEKALPGMKPDEMRLQGFLLMSAALLLDPASEEAYSFLDEGMLAAENAAYASRALAWLERLAETNPNLEKNASFLVRTAKCHRILKKYPKAKRSLETALKLDPHDSAALHESALLHEARGDMPAAMGEWARVVRSAHNDWEARYHLGALQYASGRNEAGRGNLEEAESLIAKELESSRQTDSPQRQQLISLRVDILFTLARLAFSSGENEKARELCEKAKSYSESIDDAVPLGGYHLVKGMLLVRERRFQEGLKHLQMPETADSFSADKDFIYHTAYAYYKLGDTRKAAEWADRGLALKGGNRARFDVLRATVHMKAGQAESALAFYEKALGSGGSEAERSSLRKQARELKKRLHPGIVAAVTSDDIVPALFEYYKTHPYVALWVKNVGDRASGAGTIEIDSPVFQRPLKEGLKPLKPGQSRMLRFKPPLKPEILSFKVPQPSEMTVSLNFDYGETPLQKRIAHSLLVQSRNSLFWGWEEADNQLAAFVTPEDPLIKRFVDNALKGRKWGSSETAARRIFNALHYAGLSYRGDPIQSRRRGSRQAYRPDRPKYPRETLAERQGDCEDFATLFLSGLLAAGIDAAFAFQPGHVFVLMKGDDRGWVPIETTAIDQGFLVARLIGSRNMDAPNTTIVPVSSVLNIKPELSAPEELQSTLYAEPVSTAALAYGIKDADELRRKQREIWRGLLRKYASPEGGPLYGLVAEIEGEKWFFKSEQDVSALKSEFESELEGLLKPVFTLAGGTEAARLEDVPENTVIFPDPAIIDAGTDEERALLHELEKQKEQQEHPAGPQQTP